MDDVIYIKALLHFWPSQTTLTENMHSQTQIYSLDGILKNLTFLPEVTILLTV